MTDIPKLDFLFSKIVNVNFGDQAYLVITASANASSSVSAPPPPSAAVSGPNLIGASIPVTKQTYSPPVDHLTRFFFIWPDAADFPTPETVGESVGNFPGINGAVSYGGQFSVIQNINTQGFGAVFVPGANGAGFFVSIDAANAGAVYANNQISGALTGPYSIEWLAPGGATRGPSDFGGFHSGRVDVITPGVGAGASTYKRIFVFGPLPAGAYGFAVNFGGSKSASVDAQLVAVSKKVTSFASFPGGTAVAGANDGGKATGFSVDVVVGKDLTSLDSFVAVTGSGGGGGTSV